MRAGIWREIARMHQLRTPRRSSVPSKAIHRSAFAPNGTKTLHGQAAFDHLDRISRTDWAYYLAWFQQVTGTRFGTARVFWISSRQGIFCGCIWTPKASGERKPPASSCSRTAMPAPVRSGVPDIIRRLPANTWTHTASPIQFDALKGESVGVLGAGSSAFDAAATALEHGAAEVHLYSRRAFVDYQGGPPPPASRTSTRSRGSPELQRAVLRTAGRGALARPSAAATSRGVGALSIHSSVRWRSRTFICI